MQVLIDELTEAYSTLEYLGRELAAQQYNVAHSFDGRIDPEAFNQWLRDLRTAQRKIEMVMGRLEGGKDEARRSKRR